MPYILIAGVASFIFQGIFAPGFMSGYDNSIHYYEAHYLTQTLIPHHHWISGWTMQGMAGCPVLTYHPQIGFLLIAILNMAIRLPLVLSYKLMVLFTHVFLGASFYKISSCRFSRSASLLMAISLMLQKDVWYEGILFGMWNSFLGLGLFLIFFHMLDQSIASLTLKGSTLLGFVLGLLMPTHLFAAAFASILVLIYAFPYAKDAIKKKAFIERMSLYSWIGISACLVGAPYLYPYIQTKGYLTRYDVKDICTGLIWSLKSFLGPLENVRNNPSNFMVNLPVIFRIIFSLFGLYIFLLREKREPIRRFLRSAAIFMIVALVIFSDIFPNFFSGWREIPLIGSLRTNRFLIYVQLCMYIFAAYGLGRFLERLKARRTLTAVFSILILCSVVFNYTNFGREGSETLDASKMSSFFEVWDWLNKNADGSKERVVYENTVGNARDPLLRRSDVFALSGVFTKVPYIGVFLSDSGFPQEKYMRNDNGRIFGVEIDAASASYIKDMMNRFNAKYIVTVEPKLYEKLYFSRLFAKEKKIGQLCIFRLIDFDSGWVGFEKSAKYEVVNFNEKVVRFHIYNESANNVADIKVSYHPFWQARLNGRTVQVLKGAYGMMRALLPEEGRYVLELNYKL